MQGFRLTDNDDDDPELARAFAGAVMQAEAIAEIKALRRDILTFLKALAQSH